MNRVVYTALFGNYDKLLEPKVKSLNIDYICFTDDNKLKSQIWTIIYVETSLLSNMENRKYKILPHKFLSKYEQSLYVDANIQITDNIGLLFDKYLSSTSIACSKHLERDCIYKEFDKCIQYNLVDKNIAYKQKNNYIKEGFPREYGLYDMSIIFRNHNEKSIILLMEKWFKELVLYTQRDQLSFCYILWKYGSKSFLFTIKENSKIGNNFFLIYPHIKNNFVSYYFDLIYMRKNINKIYKILYILLSKIRLLKNKIF